MEVTGMFNKSISELSNYIYQNLHSKSLSQILNHSHALGLPIKPDYSVERIIFILSQIIINFVDEIVSHEKALNSQKLMKKMRGGEQNGQQMFQGNSTLNANSQGNGGNLQLAAHIISVFCPKVLIWDILEYISIIRVQLQKQDAILQNVNLKDRIIYLPNLRYSYSCYCSIYSTQNTHHQTLECQFCGNAYHGNCQYNTICCNSCFLRFCVLDLKEETADLFNYNKEVQMIYFSYIENSYNYDHDPKYQCIYFHIVNFDIPELNVPNTDKVQKHFYIKLSLVNQIYNSQMSLPLKKQKENNYMRDSWILDNIEYHFYINNNLQRITNLISDYAIIFKIPQRLLNPFNNVLIIKCIKRNIKYKNMPIVPYWKQPEEQNKILMIGIYKVNKLKGTNKRKMKAQQQHKVLSENSGQYIKNNIINPLNESQSIQFLQLILKRINKIEYQNVDLIDVINLKKINIPVRSFGCRHVECFDLQQLKIRLRPCPQKKKSIRKRSKEKFSINIEQQEQNNKQIDLIQLESNSIEIIDPIIFNKQQNQKFHQNHSKKTHDTNRKKKFKFKKQKQEKNSLFCPICNKKMMALYIDPLFQKIIKNSGFYSKVKIFSNGQFHFYEPASLHSISKS